MARAVIDALTPRQTQVVRLMATGLRNKQIASRLGVSEKTVKMHRALLLKKLDVRSSAEAVNGRRSRKLGSKGDPEDHRSNETGLKAIVSTTSPDS